LQVGRPFFRPISALADGLMADLQHNARSMFLRES